MCVRLHPARTMFTPETLFPIGAGIAYAISGLVASLVSSSAVMRTSNGGSRLCTYEHDFAWCRDLGAHIDGWIATQATSLVVQSDPAAPVTGRAADLLAAASTAMEAALRLVRPGHRISAVPDILQKVSGP